MASSNLPALVSSKPRTTSAQRRRLQLRDELWPDVTEENLWNRKSFVGFTTIPRTLPLISRIIDSLDKKSAGRVYLELWCRAFDDYVIEIRDEYEAAFASGYDGQRAVRSWRERIDVLERLGFVRTKKTPHGTYRYTLPAATRIGMIFYPDSPSTVRSLVQAQEVAGRLGLVIRAFPVQAGDELEAVINSVAREGVDGVDIEPVNPFTSYPGETGELLLKHRVPAVSELRRIAESGGLLSYGPNLFDATRRQAYFVDRILKGAKPADLPVEQASRLELVVNLKTAQALGLTIPPLVLARADEVIE